MESAIIKTVYHTGYQTLNEQRDKRCEAPESSRLQERQPKQRFCTLKYYNHLASLQRMMFRKRAYSLLPVREYEHIGFYDVITMPCDPAAEQKKLLSV